MSFTSSDFSGVRLRRLIDFCLKVDKINQTPELINLVASETEYVGFCRKITDPQEKFQRRFAAACRTNLIDPDDIRRRMKLVASVLGVYKQVDYYKILGVTPDADAQSIKQAYRERARIFHPDKATGEDKDGAKFVKLHDAYVHLSDPQMRDLYDRTRVGAGNWIEGGEPTWRSDTGAGVGRFFSWMFILLGGLVIVAYAFDLIQDGRIPILFDHFPSDRPNDQFAASTRIPAESAVRDGLTASEKNNLEVAELRKYFPEPTPMGMEPIDRLAEIEDVLMFFNPRREKRYWASETSRHETLDDAVAALAEMYHRTPEWVQLNMGEENTLPVIHRKLGAQQAFEKALAEKTIIDAMPQVEATEAAIHQETPAVAAQAAASDPGPGPMARLDQIDEPEAVVAILSKTKSAAFPEKETASGDLPVMSAPKVRTDTETASVDVTMHRKQDQSTVLETGAGKHEKAVAATSKKTKVRLPDTSGVLNQKEKAQPIKQTVSRGEPAAANQRKPTVIEASAGMYEGASAQKSRRAAIIPMARTSALKPIKTDPVDYVEKQRRVAAFIDQFTNAYEQKDLNRFQSFFAEGALEQGEQFEKMLPTYRRTFSLVEALRYKIDLQSLTVDAAKKIVVEGAFTASYRLPKKNWGSSSGSIRLVLLDTPNGLLVSRLDYEKKGEEAGKGGSEAAGKSRREDERKSGGAETGKSGS